MTSQPITLAEFQAALLNHADSTHINPTDGFNCLYSIEPTEGNPEGYEPSPTGATHCIIGQVIVDLGLPPLPPFGPSAATALLQVQDAFDLRDFPAIQDLAHRVQRLADGDANVAPPELLRIMPTWGEAIAQAFAEDVE